MLTPILHQRQEMLFWGGLGVAYCDLGEGKLALQHTDSVAHCSNDQGTTGHRGLFETFGWPICL